MWDRHEHVKQLQTLKSQLRNECNWFVQKISHQDKIPMQDNVIFHGSVNGIFQMNI